MPHFNRFSLVLVLIIFVAAFFRLINLGKNPSGFFCDEASIGYNALHIWNSGTDEYGQSWPLLFKSVGDYKNPVFIYSLTPLVGILGLSEYTVRLGAVIYGLLAVVAIFLYVRELSDTKTALLSALLLAISPWHIHFSRVGFEVIASVFYVIMSFYLLEISLKKNRFYPFAVVFLILSFFSYTTPKVYLPPLFILFFIIHWRSALKISKTRIFWITNIIALILVLFCLRPYLQNGTFFARWNQVNHTSMPASDLISGYLNHFSLDFLFKKGDIDFPGQFITRHSVRGMGELYWFQLPLLIFYFIYLISLKFSKPSQTFLLIWLLIYPLGTMFTQTAPQATRSIIGVVPFQIMTAFGFFWFLTVAGKFRFRKLYLLLFIISVSLSVARFIHLLNLYPQYSSDYWGWQFGARDVMSYFVKESPSFDKLCLEGAFNAPETFLKFYDVNDSCHGKCQICDTSVYNPESKQLFAVTPDTFNTKVQQSFPGFVVNKTIYYPNGRPAFIIGKIH
ncbi:MAG TPA: glycosyltransferase family 39 protein [Patescibacteria group bacterium]